MTVVDPIAFIRDVLRDPETGKPFELYPAQERFLRLALTPTADGRLPFAELLYGAPKKSGKTTTAAMAMLYVICVLGGLYAEGYCVANDLEQAQGRVFQACVRIIEASPVLRAELAAPPTRDCIVFKNGATIRALASDYAGAAGANPTFTVFDELWAYTSERAYRLWDEMVPPPTRQIAARMTVTYAGFEGESDLLEKLYRRGLQGEALAA
jgi:phage terminase large subunit-like protein